jgi:hypothetical protein
MREPEKKASAPVIVAVRQTSNGPTPIQSKIPVPPQNVKEKGIPLEQMMEAEIASIKQLLPIRTDDYMSVVDVKYFKQTLYFIERRREWMGPRRFSINLRYSHDGYVKNVCANPYLVRFMKRGIAIQYNFLNYDGSRMAEEIFYPQECGA